MSCTGNNRQYGLRTTPIPAREPEKRDHGDLHINRQGAHKASKLLGMISLLLRPAEQS